MGGYGVQSQPRLHSYILSERMEKDSTKAVSSLALGVGLTYVQSKHMSERDQAEGWMVSGTVTIISLKQH